MKAFTAHSNETTVHTALIAALITFTVLSAQAANNQPQPVNKIAIILDASGSYRSRQAEAMQHVLDRLEAKLFGTRVSKYDHAVDEIAIISLDAMLEILWQGDLKQLKTLDSQSWTVRFKARIDYASCTDVGAAFRVAAKFLEGDPVYVRQTVIAYSDLIDEKPANSLRKCDMPQAVAQDFPWADLRNAAINVLWLPPDQKLAWQREADAHGLTDVHFYTVSESAQAPIALPPPAKLPADVVNAQRATKRKEAIGFFSKLATMAGKVMGGLVTVIVLLVLWSVFRGKRKRSRRAASARQSTRK